MQHPSRIPSAGERIAVVDVLRAIALLGIIITHCAQGFLAGRPPKPGFMNLTALDGIVMNLGTLLTFGKFFTIFSFLFGLSFALQMRSAAQKGSAFTGRFTWRLVVLALIALVHNVFYAGDILIIYAFLGLLLIPVPRREHPGAAGGRAVVDLQYSGPGSRLARAQRAAARCRAAASGRADAGAGHAIRAATIRHQEIRTSRGDHARQSHRRHGGETRLPAALGTVVDHLRPVPVRPVRRAAGDFP